MEDLDQHDVEPDLQYLPAAPLAVWHQLQSYLVLEKLVELHEEQTKDVAVVTIRVHNTAPDSEDIPAVVFNSINISTRGSRDSHHERLDSLLPGQTRELVFKFSVKQLLSVEFEVQGEIDAEKLLQFSRKTSLSSEVIAPLQSEFIQQFDSIGIREFVDSVLAVISNPKPEMAIGEIARMRESLNEKSQLIEEKQIAFDKLYREFQLDGASTLGARIRELVRALLEFGRKIKALDQAISQTDIHAMNGAIHDLQQMQIAVLRVEGAVRNTTSSA